MSRFEKLWVFGDSYMTPDECVSPQESCWGLTASALGIPLIKNLSRRSNSFDTINHLLVSLQPEYNWEKDLFLIGIPPLERITVFDDFKDTAYTGTDFYLGQDWQRSSFDVSTHRGLICLQNYGNDKEYLIHSDRSWTECQAQRTLFLLTTWLDSMKANYVIMNMSKGFNRQSLWGPSEFVLPYVEQHPRLILFEDCYYEINLDVNKPADFDIHGWFGHHGPQGNRHYFDKSLWPRLVQCGMTQEA